MKPKIVLLVVFTAGLFFNAFSQEKEFDLRNYQTTDYEKSKLDLRFNLNENYSQRADTYLYYNNSIDEYKNLASKVYFYTTGVYSKLKLSKKRIQSYDISLSNKINYLIYCLKT